MKTSPKLGATVCRYLAYIGVVMAAWLPALPLSSVVLLVGVFGSVAISQNRRANEGAGYSRFSKVDPDDMEKKKTNA
ncbi:MAG: hypothetical protein ACOYM5_01280 [Caulobacter sp.]